MKPSLAKLSEPNNYNWQFTFSPDGKFVVARLDAGVLALELATGRRLSWLKRPAIGVQAEYLTPDGRRLARLTRAGTLEIYDVTTGQVLGRLTDSGAALSPLPPTAPRSTAPKPPAPDRPRPGRGRRSRTPVDLFGR